MPSETFFRAQLSQESDDKCPRPDIDSTRPDIDSALERLDNPKYGPWVSEIRVRARGKSQTQERANLSARMHQHGRSLDVKAGGEPENETHYS
jgi:hypothetical protein